MLDVGDGQFLQWEQCGNPGGKPALVLHGGPGSGCSPWMRQLFDPDVYRVVLFDQRGAGRSLPHASEPSADLSVNTTAHLVADIERLREHLGIERWLVHGMSRGSSLGLAYAKAHPQPVSEVVLAAVTMTHRCDVDWFARGVGRFFPAQGQAFRDGVPAADRDGDLVSAYARLLASPDTTVREQAARNWCDWEEAIVAVETGGTPNPRYADPRFRMGFARLVTHYFSHAAWLEDDQLLREADRLAGIPSVLIHGRLDLGSPLRAAWRLARAWPGSELVILDTSGHTSTDLREHVVAAIERSPERRTSSAGRVPQAEGPTGTWPASRRLSAVACAPLSYKMPLKGAVKGASNETPQTLASARHAGVRTALSTALAMDEVQECGSITRRLLLCPIRESSAPPAVRPLLLLRTTRRRPCPMTCALNDGAAVRRAVGGSPGTLELIDGEMSGAALV